MVFVHADGTFVREGECCRCGQCCFGDPFQGARGAPQIPGACPLLTLHTDGYVCTDRNDPYYLAGCNVWPTHPGQIADKPGCTYRFELVDGS